MLHFHRSALTAIITAALASAALNVAAAPDQAQSKQAPNQVVVKDTRQYMTYTQQVTESGSCAMAKDPDHPEKGDCPEVRSKAVVGGDYIVRVGNMCRSESYSHEKGNDLTLEGRSFGPSIGIKVNTYKCDEQGNPA
jgi:uncharacterized low-complexity protein